MFTFGLIERQTRNRRPIKNLFLKNRLTDEGARHLSDALKNRNLKHTELSKKKLTDVKVFVVQVML